MTTEASPAEPLLKQRISDSAFPILLLHRKLAISDCTFDVVQLAQEICSGGLAKETHMPLPEARGQSEAHGDRIYIHNTIVGVP